MATQGNDDDGDDDDACSDENGEDENCRNGDNDRAFVGEELEFYTNPADTQADELSNLMEAEATTFVAAAPMPNRESVPAGVEPRAFCCPGSTPAGTDSRLEDCIEQGTAANNNMIWDELSLALADPEINEQALTISGSRRDNDDSSFEEVDWQMIWEHDLLSSLGVNSIDVANIPTVDTAEPSTSCATNTAAEPAQQPSLTYPKMVKAAGMFLRTHVPFLPEEHVDDLAQSMVRTFIDDGRRYVRNIPDQMMRYFISLFGKIEWPNTLERLHTWLLHCLQPAAPITSDGENSKKTEAKAGKKRANPSSTNNEKKKKKTYRCPYCGEAKVTWNGSTKIPHACPKLLEIIGKGTKVTNDKGTEVTEEGGGDNDIDRVLKYPPKKYKVRYASNPAVICGLVGAGNDDDGDDISDDDRQPAAVNVNDNDSDGDRKPAAIVRRNARTASPPTASRHSPRTSSVTREEGQSFHAATSLPTPKQAKDNGNSKTENKMEEEGEDFSAVQEVVDSEESPTYRQVRPALVSCPTTLCLCFRSVCMSV
jgi:hypothetical protein